MSVLQIGITKHKILSLKELGHWSTGPYFSWEKQSCLQSPLKWDLTLEATIISNEVAPTSYLSDGMAHIRDFPETTADSYFDPGEASHVSQDQDVGSEIFTCELKAGPGKRFN